MRLSRGAELVFARGAAGCRGGESDLRLEGVSVWAGKGPDPADQLPEIADQPAVSRAGDLWQLGRHRILCGDALEPGSFDALMQGVPAQVVFTDPPYNVPIIGFVSGKGRVRHREFPMASGEMTRARFTRFLTTVLQLLARHSTAGSLHFLCMDWRHQFELLTAAEAVYSELKNLCVSVKDNAGMGSLYRTHHGPTLVFKNAKTPPPHNAQPVQHT